MKVDLFTKVCLLFIAIFLGIIALYPFFTPEIAHGAPFSEQKLDYIEPIGMTFALGVLLDTRNGDIWAYDLDNLSAQYCGRLEELGKPLFREPR